MQKISETLTKKQKRQLDVLEPGEKRHQKLWDKCVAEAKALVEKQQDIKMELVALAEKCCVIHHGGRASNSRYTLRRFAKDIGIPWSTFYDWYQVKKNITDNLTEAQRKKLTFNQQRDIRKQMTGINWKDKKIRHIVQGEIKRIKQKNETTIKMEKYCKHLRALHFNCTNRLMIKDCDKEVIGEISHLCREIVFHLAKFDRKTKKQ